MMARRLKKDRKRKRQRGDDDDFELERLAEVKRREKEKKLVNPGYLLISRVNKSVYRRYSQE